jgi:hypothetical protein
MDQVNDLSLSSAEPRLPQSVEFVFKVSEPLLLPIEGMAHSAVRPMSSPLETIRRRRIVRRSALAANQASPTGGYHALGLHKPVRMP